MGGDFSNISKMSNQGNSQLQNCKGKNTKECQAVNYYDTPDMRDKQQGAESSVGRTNAMLKKKITTDVDLQTYCQSHPSDITCQLCQKNPNQEMCKQANKCTTAEYTGSSGGKEAFNCEIVGSSDYSCNKWLDNVAWHNNHTPQNYVEGGTVNARTSSNKCDAIGNSSYNFVINSDSAWIRVITRKITNQQKVLNFVFFANSGKSGCKSISGNLQMNPTSGNLKLGAVNMLWQGASKNGKDVNLWQQSGANCNNTTCNIQLRLEGGNKGTDQTTTITFPAPIEEKDETIIDNISWTDNCIR